MTYLPPRTGSREHERHPNHALVEAWYDAYTRRDVDALCALAREDIEITSKSVLQERLAGASFHGRRGVRTLMEWAFERYPVTRVSGLATRAVGHSTLARTTYLYAQAGTPMREFTSFTLFDCTGDGISRVRIFGSETEALESAREDPLSAREREVLQLLARGLNARQVAEELVLSPGTVRTHVRNAMVHLGARTRVEATALALERGDIRL
jgi:DNA-binding CsgD family transcriptional regulator/ketosteroid isomerase-like protein